MSTAEQAVVVGVDGSAWSAKALRTGARIAAAVGAPLEAITCWDVAPVYAGYGTYDAEYFHTKARETLDGAVAEAFGDDPPAGLARRLVRGHPAEELVEASRGAQLLVVGRRGTGGFGALLLGSVSSACVVHAHCPVLVVREDVPVRI
jgi:nucleotide-binding universal stress UspA family protein